MVPVDYGWDFYAKQMGNLAPIDADTKYGLEYIKTFVLSTDVLQTLDEIHGRIAAHNGPRQYKIERCVHIEQEYQLIQPTLPF